MLMNFTMFHITIIPPKTETMTDIIPLFTQKRNLSDYGVTLQQMTNSGHNATRNSHNYTALIMFLARPIRREKETATTAKAEIETAAFLPAAKKQVTTACSQGFFCFSRGRMGGGWAWRRPFSNARGCGRLWARAIQSAFGLGVVGQWMPSSLLISASGRVGTLGRDGCRFWFFLRGVGKAHSNGRLGRARARWAGMS